MISIAIIGGRGRMGSRIIALAREAPSRFHVTGEVTRESGEIGSPQVVIDFSAPAATRHWLPICRVQKQAMLIGTTGLDASDQRLIDAASHDIAILQATNTSLGVAVLNKLAAETARMFGDGCDVEIIEAHHRFKKDAPSGTAITLGKAIGDVTGRQVPTHSLRIGDEVGTHTAVFAALGERLELTHRATSRDTFAHGALRAAEWLARQNPGRYRMADVLGI